MYNIGYSNGRTKAVLEDVLRAKLAALALLQEQIKNLRQEINEFDQMSQPKDARDFLIE